MVREEQYRDVKVKEVSLGDTVGFIGVDDDAVPHRIVKWINNGLFDSVSNFESFVEENSEKLFKWDKFEKDKEYKDALFARFLVNIKKHFKLEDKGMYYVEGNLFNGRIYVPKGIKEGKISVLESNYFTRLAFTEYVKGSNACDSDYLGKYKKHIRQFDKETNVYLDGFINSDGKEETINKLFRDSWAVMSHTVNVLVKTLDGHMYTVRGVNAAGAGEVSLITGIVDRKDLEGIVKVELKEEMGIEDDIGNVEQVGCSVVEQITKQRRVVILCVNYVVEVSKTKDEIQGSYLRAVDKYENEELYFVKGSVQEFKRELNRKINKSVTLESFLSKVKE